MAFLMESDAVVRFVITLILFQLLGIEIPACVCCHPVQSFQKRLKITIFNSIVPYTLKISHNKIIIIIIAA